MSEFKLDGMEEFCGCGKPVRYMSGKDKRGGCSKYGRCPSYDELAKMLEIANLKLYRLKEILEEGNGTG